MKTRNKKTLFICGACLAIPAALYAVVTQYEDVEIRQNTDAVNTVDEGSLAVGYTNNADKRSVSIGTYNSTYNRALAVGHGSWVGNYSGAVGQGHQVNWHTTPSGYPRNSFATGNYNSVLGSESFAAGRSNDVTAHRSSVMGYGIVVTEDDAVVVGKFNEDKSGVQFVVGNGGYYTSRKNAFEVHKNGDVIVNKEQGDISMGGFGN